MDNTLLTLNNLTVSFKMGETYYNAVDGIDLTINENEVFAIVGESGCGKSATALTILQLHDMHYTKLSGAINYKGTDLLSLSPKALSKIRGNDIAMIFQDPLSSLNPLHRIGRQIEESLALHTNLSKEEQKTKALGLLADVGIPDPERTYQCFPHELSGGMRQRVVIAIALSCEPSLLIADEPTTALDVTIQSQILDLMNDLKKRTQASVILITHDMGVVAEMADRVAVMYAGQIVELATVRELFKNPLHPYTRSLLSSVPRKGAATDKLSTIQGAVPTLVNLPREGCRFSHRIPWIADSEHEVDPVLREVTQGHWVRCTCYQNFAFQTSDALESTPLNINAQGEGA